MNETTAWLVYIVGVVLFFTVVEVSGAMRRQGGDRVRTVFASLLWPVAAPMVLVAASIFAFIEIHEVRKARRRKHRKHKRDFRTKRLED